MVRNWKDELSRTCNALDDIFSHSGRDDQNVTARVRVDLPYQ